jgi:hypothetical protein
LARENGVQHSESSILKLYETLTERCGNEIELPPILLSGLKLVATNI